MTTINDLRDVADEMAGFINYDQEPGVSHVRRWCNTVHEFTETPRCPMCGTSVGPKTYWAPEVAPCVYVECGACQHDSGLYLNEQDALAAFYNGK